MHFFFPDSLPLSALPTSHHAVPLGLPTSLSQDSERCHFPSFFSFLLLSDVTQSSGTLSLELWIIFPTLHLKPSSSCVAACPLRDCPLCWLPSKGMALSFLCFSPQGATACLPKSFLLNSNKTVSKLRVEPVLQFFFVDNTKTIKRSPSFPGSAG